MSDNPLPDDLIPDDDDPSQVEDHIAQQVSIERVLQLLNHGTIIEDHGRLRWSSNYTTIVTVKDETLEALGVYKPQCGERPLWDFPDGTLCYREVAAYHVSEALGWGLVAPTVLREGPKGLGSLQLYIQHDPAINYFSLSDDFIPQLKMFAAFDVLVNNTDRKGGHCLVDSQDKLWAIDHGICFHTMPKLRTVIWDFVGQPLPKALLNDISRVLEGLRAEGEVYQQLHPLLSERERQALVARFAKLLKRKTFPYPSHGPSYPWPPV